MSGGAEISVRSAEPDFRVDTLSGDTVSLDGLSGDRALVGFFLAGCTPCNSQLPTFVELAKTILGSPSQVVAVLSGMPDKTAEYAARLVGVASVVLESPRADEGTMSRAFFTPPRSRSRDNPLTPRTTRHRFS